MPFDNEGVFSRLHNWEDDRINDIDIVTDHMDEEDDNFADGLSQCFLKKGTSKMEGNFNVGNFKITNLADGTQSSDAVNRKQLDKASSDTSQSFKTLMNALVEIGDIKASVLSENHGGWLLCGGQAVSRTDYADLFEVIGTQFGEGNGETTFNVPDYRGKFLRGLGGNSAADIYTAQAEGLPDHDHSHTTYSTHGSSGGGAAKAWCNGDMPTGQFTTTFSKASASSAVYGASAHVTPENYAVNWFIKAKKEE